MPSDPCKWQWKTCGYRKMVVYPQEGSQCLKLHWSSMTWKFNLARPFGGEISSSASLVSWRGHFQRRSAETFWPYPEPEDILIDIDRCMKNLPLLYQGEEFEQPVLTPNALLIPPAPLLVGSSLIEKFSCYKLLRVHLSDNLTRNEHVTHIVKKGSKRLYAIRALKKCGLTDQDYHQVCFRVCESRLGWPHAILKWSNWMNTKEGAKNYFSVSVLWGRA